MLLLRKVKRVRRGIRSYLVEQCVGSFKSFFFDERIRYGALQCVDFSSSLQYDVAVCHHFVMWIHGAFFLPWIWWMTINAILCISFKRMKKDKENRTSSTECRNRAKEFILLLMSMTNKTNVSMCCKVSTKNERLYRFNIKLPVWIHEGCFRCERTTTTNYQLFLNRDNVE